MILRILEGEAFYGGAATDGVSQPYTGDTEIELDLTHNTTPNQMMPLLLSTAGRWLFHPEGMRVNFQKGRLVCPDDTLSGGPGGGLREAYLDAMRHCFPWHEIRLDGRLFSKPVYNTWIELTFRQSQDRVLRYASEILENGLPAGVLMIDDGWSDYYGRWRFGAGKFADPGKMLRTLHEMGFAVMLWVSPFITPDTTEYRQLERDGLLAKDGAGQTCITHWWNGWSAVLDMTLPAACAWLKEQLDGLQELGVDGFKFDGGDSIYYPSDGTVSGDEHSRAWAAFGEQYALNEYRAAAGAGGWSLMQRQCDKEHSWGASGLQALIPDAIVQGLTGHPFLCPDMIGGGEYRNFYAQDKLDQELFVRWAQIACLMPVMQFSAAPWRVLSKENYEKVLRAVALRGRYAPILDKALAKCRLTGEPVLRPMSYVFPDAACVPVTDQFMIGDSLLAAPIYEKGAAGRSVYLPRGCWLSGEGQTIQSKGESCRITPADGIGIFVKRG